MSGKPFVFTEIFSILLRRKWHFAIPAFLTFSVASALAYFLPPVYLSTATILIEQQEIPRNLVASTVTGYAAERIQVIQNKVMTRDNLGKIAEKFNLYPEKRSPEIQQDVIEQMREDIDLQMVSADIVDPQTGRSRTATIAFTVSYENKSPKLAQAVTAELAELYLNENRISRTEDARNTAEFIKAEAQRRNEQVSELEAKLAEFKKTNALYLPDSFQTTRNSLDAALQQRDQLAATVTALEGRRQYLKNQLNGYGLAGQLAQARQDLAAAREQYSELYPDVISLKNKVETLQSQLDQENRSGSRGISVTTSSDRDYRTLQSDLQGVMTDLTASRIQLADMNNKISDYQARLAKMPDVEREYSTLRRELDDATTKYRDISDKLVGADLAETLEREQKAERFTLIERANQPASPIKPNRLGVLLLGLMLALGAGLGVAAAAEYLDRRIFSPTEFAAVFKAPPLAMIPEIPGDVSS